MDRDAALRFLTQEFADLATEAQFTDTQRVSAYSAIIDMALRQLGVDEVALSGYDVAQAQVMAYIALLRYHALRRFATALSTRVAVMLPGPVKAERNQAFSQVQAMLAQAEDDLVKLGLDLGPTWQMGRVNLDFLEPGIQGEFAVPPFNVGWW